MADRERYLTFALTAAEMLLEVSLDGRIGFAAGAFQARLGQPTEAWLGRPVAELVAPPDRQAFAIAFQMLLAHDRMPPTRFRLADDAGTPVAFAGLRLPERQAGRLYLTVGALPMPPAIPLSLTGDAALRDAAEGLLRGGIPGGTLGLIDVAEPLGAAPSGLLAPLISRVLADALAADGVVEEISAGRYGLVSTGAIDLAAIGAQLEAAVHQAGIEASVATVGLALDATGMTPMQANRALRYALASFERGGPQAMAEAGFADGLAGFVTLACSRTVAVRHQIAERRFDLAFQPVVSLHDGTVHHYEALLRPQPGRDDQPINTQSFVTFAETVGLAEELDWAVLESVFAAARRGRGAHIAANLSGLSLQSPAFRTRMLALLDTEPMLLSRLLIEITETAEIEDEAEAMRTVAALRDRGLPLCIDDFGAGAASFRYLRTFRVDYVKIDGSYVRNALRSDQDRAIIASMVDLARKVGARSVAEQIETEAEAALMRSLGVDLGQGWLFGRPSPLPMG